MSVCCLLKLSATTSYRSLSSLLPAIRPACSYNVGVQPCNFKGAVRGYATVMGPATTEDESFVEQDIHKLMHFACINYLKEGADTQVLSDEEYPDWLWQLQLERSLRFDEMNPQEHGLDFWNAYNTELKKQQAACDRLHARNFYVQYNIKGSHEQPKHKKSKHPIKNLKGGGQYHGIGEKYTKILRYSQGQIQKTKK